MFKSELYRSRGLQVTTIQTEPYRPSVIGVGLEGVPADMIRTKLCRHRDNRLHRARKRNGLVNCTGLTIIWLLSVRAS